MVALPGYELLNFWRIPVGGGLDELFGDVTGHVGLEELLEEGRQPLAARGARDRAVAGNLGHGRGIVSPRRPANLNF